MRVAVLAGGRSSEHNVSLDSGATVSAALEEAGHEVLSVRLSRDGSWKGPDGAALSLVPGGGLLGAEVAFPVLHGPFGEDGTIQGLLELLDVPYVGAGVLASSLCMDKVVFKEVLAAAGVPQVGYLAVRETAWQDTPDAVRSSLAALGLPLFVKPARLGSSVGISKVADGRGARRGARDRVPARRAGDRRGVLARHRGRVLGDRQRGARRRRCRPRSCSRGPIGTTTRRSTRRAGSSSRSRRGWTSAVIEEIQALARETFLRVGCSGLARVDFFVEDGGRVLVNELNTLPGMTATSGFPKMWEATGRSFPSVCDRLLALGLERYRAERAGHAF